MKSVGPFCGRVQDKCMYVPLLAQLTAEQNAGRPGRLGPVASFEGEGFFARFLDSEMTIRIILQGPAQLRGFGTIVAFGDIHGDLLSLLGVLHAAGCIDQNAHWLPSPDPTAPKRCVIQLGDLLDRGGRGDTSVDTSHSAREEVNLIEYVYALDLEARAVGERVLSLSGNHEEVALRAAFDPELAARFVYTTKQTACPFPRARRSREQVFATKGALRYFAMHRPPMAVSSLGWLFAHGDVPVQSLRRFKEKTHTKLIASIRSHTEMSTAEAVIGAVNLVWAAYVLELGGDLVLTRMLRKVLPRYESKTGFPPVKLSSFPNDVMTCRTLANMGKPRGVVCDCEGRVDEVGRLLGLDWPVSGGIALGHSVSASISTQCQGKVQLLDIGMSEAFRGFNVEGKVAWLRVGVQQSIEHGERA